MFDVRRSAFGVRCSRVHQGGLGKMNAEQILIWLAFAVCLALSFLLSGMEAGVFALSRMRVRQQMRAGRRSAEVLHGYLENPENFLWTILVGNTLANFIILGMILMALY